MSKKIGMYFENDILQFGIANVPQVVVRYGTEAGLTNAEYKLVVLIFSFKFDDRHPYPSQTTLAKLFFGEENYKSKSSERTIRHHLESMSKKGLLIKGQMVYEDGTFGPSVYNFKPLIERCLQIAEEKREQQLAETKKYKIIWENGQITDETLKNLSKPSDTEYPTEMLPADIEYPTPADTEYPPKIKIKEEEEKITPPVSSSISSSIDDVVQLVEENICRVTPLIRKQIIYYTSKLSIDVVKAEIECCIEKSAKTWKYIATALEQDLKEQIFTVESVYAKHESKPKRLAKKQEEKAKQTTTDEWKINRSFSTFDREALLADFKASIERGSEL